MLGRSSEICVKNNQHEEDGARGRGRGDDPSIAPEKPEERLERDLIVVAELSKIHLA